MAKKLLRAVLRCFVALLPFLLLMVRELPAGRESGNMESYFLSVFGGPASAGGDIALLFLELVPSVLIFYLFSGVMLEDCAINYVYVFPRMGKMGPWLRQKVLWLLAQILFTFLLAFAVGFAFGFGAGFRVKQGLRQTSVISMRGSVCDVLHTKLSFPWSRTYEVLCYHTDFLHCQH